MVAQFAQSSATGPDSAATGIQAAPGLAEKALAAGRITLRATQDSLWCSLEAGGGGIALRLAFCPGGHLELRQLDAGSRWTVDSATVVGSVRTTIEFPESAFGLLHATSRLITADAQTIGDWPRDLVPIGPETDGPGTIHTAQRGPRSGVVYGSTPGMDPFTFLYLQDFSGASPYFEDTATSPAGRVAGAWPDLGYALPPSGPKPLRPGAEYVLADVFLGWVAGLPGDDVAVARTYLDLLAETYLAMERPEPVCRDWPSLAEHTLRDLTFSPEVSERRNGQRHLLPYVGDRTKPPESMVQFTVLLPLLEYADWSGGPDRLGRELLRGIPEFFDERIGSLVRWLPGAPFLEQSEAVQTHGAMDSWYLYHILFNLSRAAKLGDRPAGRLFQRSLAYAIKVARRFNYRWPVFFDLESLEVVRAEASPGRGGENDVAGLYALVMIEAYEATQDDEYLREARTAAESLAGLGFRLGYQTNTTGFGAEAMLRLAHLTGDDTYLGTADVCIANLLDNVWLWQANYGHGTERRTFFGMFPLHDAPYLAAYEEAEMVAKVHDYLNIGRDELRPSVRLLLSEWVKFATDRMWAYLPANQPAKAVASESRVGRIARELSVPVEDLPDGWAEAGQVGQEVYGAGIAFVATTRHFRKLPGTSLLLYWEYPVFDLRTQARGRSGSARFTMAGNRRTAAAIRVIPRDPGQTMPEVRLEVAGSRRRIRSQETTEGHLRFEVRGGQSVRLVWKAAAAPRKPRAGG